MVMKFLNKIKQYKYILGSIILIGLLIVFISYSFAVSVPVASIQIKSENLNYDNSEQGSWKIVKSAVRTDKNKARITFDVDTVEKNSNKDRDIILVIDSSSSMSSNISDALLEVLNELEDDSNTNRVALISFNSSASILSDFTSDLDSIYTLVNGLTISGNTNYYKALLKVDDLLNDYSFSSNKNTSVIFITDGYPTEDIPNEVGEYNYLKEEYKELDIQAIQYNNSDVVLDEIKNISDKQYIANSSNIKDVLYRSMFGVVTYDSFIIEDNVSSYFNIDSVSSSLGDVDINNNKVTLDIGKNLFDSGTSVKLNIDISLKDEYMDIEGLYETNSSEVITSSINGINENITSSDSPILANSYTVTYDGNAPSTCFVTNVPNSSKYSVFDTVSISSNVPVCFGYQFKGWEIVNTGIKKINDDYFIMPSENVVLKATWSKLGLIKSSTGTVREATTLYKVIENEAISGGVAKEYTGSHQDSMAGVGSKTIYYYSGNTVDEGNTVKEKNNVIFAGHCWQMIRTTDTGGVKMIYNGEPDSDNQCGDDRGTHVGYAGDDTIALNSNYYYGTSYEYNSSSKTFSLAGTITNGTWSDSTYQDFVGKYTCKKSSSSGTCSTLYYVEKYSTASKAHVLLINSSSHYSQIGTQEFNESSNSIAYVGYMYDRVYSYKNINFADNYEAIFEYDTSFTTSYWYSDSVSYNSSTGVYSLVSPYQVSSLADVKGKYTFKKTSKNSTSSSAYYIMAVDDPYVYYIQVSSGKTASYYNYKLTYGENYVDNGDGTYTIEDAETTNTIYRNEYYDYYLYLKKKYVCKNAVNKVCSDLWYVTSVEDYYFNYEKIDTSYKFGKNFTYNNGSYILSDNIIDVWDFGSSNAKSRMNNAHYTCLNTTGKCVTLYYVFNMVNENLYYIELLDGKSVSDAIDEMLYDDVNTNSSAIKSAIDAWYKRYMTDYTDYLEDTIFCNDRNIRSLGGWNPNGGGIYGAWLTFQQNQVTSNLSCSNVTDKFSVSNNEAKLNYPIGLASSPELNLFGKYARKTGKNYWSISPDNYGDTDIYNGIKYINISGLMNYSVSYSKYGVRPVISLAPGTEYSYGDGSTTNPYVVDTSS